MRIVSRIIVNFCCLLAFAGLFPTEIFIANWQVALIGAFLLTLLETFVAPFLKILFLPINLLTLGIFGLVINACMLEFTSYLMGSELKFYSFFVVFWMSLLMSLCNYVITTYLRQS